MKRKEYERAKILEEQIKQLTSLLEPDDTEGWREYSTMTVKICGKAKMEQRGSRLMSVSLDIKDLKLLESIVTLINEHRYQLVDELDRILEED